MLTLLFQALLDGRAVDRAAFENASRAHFATTPVPNAYFNNLATMALPRNQTTLADLQMLDLGLRIAHQWEASTGGRVHKGTGYYFAGMRDIMLGNLDRGFLYMHQAMVEDEKSAGHVMPDAPALAFVTLNSLKRNQFFRPEVMRNARLLQARMQSYRRSGRGRLRFAELRSKILAEPALIESAFQLTYVLARMRRLERPDIAFARDNLFARTMLGQLLFDLCLIIDQALQTRVPGVWRFYQLATHYRRTASGGGAGLRMRQVDLDAIAALKGNAVSAAIEDLLDGRYRLTSGAAPDPLSADLLTAYALRNHMAHGIAGDPVLERRFEAIEKRLFFMYFSVMERLYP